MLLVLKKKIFFFKYIYKFFDALLGYKHPSKDSDEVCGRNDVA